MQNEALDLTHLGKISPIENDPDKVKLDLIPKPNVNLIYCCRFSIPEFQSLCIAGDTLIDTARNEKEHPTGIPIKNLVGKEGILFSYDTKTNLPIAKKFFDVRKTRNSPTVKIVLNKRLPSRDGGGYSDKEVVIEVTPDHPILVRRGFRGHEWVEAQNLKSGDRLISNQSVPNVDTIRGKLRHRLVAECKLGRGLKHIEHVHHINHSHFDNSPENIEIISQSGHLRYHRTVEYGYHESINIDQLIEEYNSCKNISQLAALYKCDGSTIVSRLRSRGVQTFTQSEVLINKHNTSHEEVIKECVNLYLRGYTTYELSQYYNLHPTSVSAWLKKSGVEIRESNRSRWDRRKLDLPSLNHKVVHILPGPKQDVYNMEVEDTHCFFGNGVVLHNCPQTGQPDYATILIDYVPYKHLIESKALKLWMFAFRNHGSFHEAVTSSIADRFYKEVKPYWLRVASFFNCRGGISIDTVVELGILPMGVHPLSIDNMKPYLGRL